MILRAPLSLPVLSLPKDQQLTDDRSLFASPTYRSACRYDADTDAGQPDAAILLNRDLAGEPLVVIASYLVEGTLLPTADNGPIDPDRAVAAALLGTLAYADLLATAPDDAVANTRGVATRNRELLALLNSSALAGGTGGASPIGFRSAPPGVTDVLPGLYVDAPSFADYVRPSGPAPVDERRWQDEDTLAFRAYLAPANHVGEPRIRSAGTTTLGEIEPAVAAFLSPDQIVELAGTLQLGVLASFP